MLTNSKRGSSLKYPETSKTLLEKMTGGDEVSWEEFIARYSEIIISLGRLKGLTDTECDDLLQEVMFRFFQNSKTFVFDPGIARFRTYFGRIIHGKIIDILRKRPPVSVPVCDTDAQAECFWFRIRISVSLSDARHRTAHLPGNRFLRIYLNKMVRYLIW